MDMTPLSELDPKALLTRKEAAHHLQLSPRTLDQWAWNGGTTLKFVKIGRLVRYQVQDVLDFINQSKMTHTEAA